MHTYYLSLLAALRHCFLTLHKPPANPGGIISAIKVLLQARGHCHGAVAEAGCLHGQAEDLLHGNSAAPAFASVHPGYGGLVHAEDLNLHRFIPDAQFAEWADTMTSLSLPDAPTVVLLTGSNGFLGRFLLLELLQRAAKRCDSSCCLRCH